MDEEKSEIQKQDHNEGTSWFSVLAVLGVVAIGAIAYAKINKKI